MYTKRSIVQNNDKLIKIGFVFVSEQHMRHRRRAFVVLQMHEPILGGVRKLKTMAR
jgi:hypothetical protein